MKLRIWRNNQFNVWQPNFWDIVSLLLILSVIVALAWAATQMSSPYELGKALPISLAPSHLPRYALRTIFRMAIGLIASLLFTFTVGSLAAKNKHAERFLIPFVDILQSVPVLGFLSISVIPFIMLFPNSLLGPELAAIFAIFTSQAWNMFLGFYQSLKTLPDDLREASLMLQLSGWQRFWRVEVPFSMPSLIWNMMMSLSASWFFIVACEALTVHNQKILLPGVGSYIATAIMQSDKTAVLYAIITMLIVILLYDQLLFKPLIEWSEKFKAEETEEKFSSTSLLNYLMRRTKLLVYLGGFFQIGLDGFVNLRLFARSHVLDKPTSKKTGAVNFVVIAWYCLIALISLVALVFLIQFIFAALTIHDFSHVMMLGLYTSLRIIVLIFLCSLVWVPIGVWVGLRPRVTRIVQPIAQFLAAFPANLLFPVVVILIIRYKLNVEIWTTPLMILGTQWYVLFNVIAGTSALPKDLIYATKNFKVTGFLWWRRFILPGIFPYLITGAITAAGGAWNASIVAEIVHWGDKTLVASGLGAYITQATTAGDFPRIALGIGVMCLYVLIFNRLIWQPLYNMAEKRFQLG